MFSSTLTSVNKIEKSAGFIQSDDILKDVLFGARKSNITSEHRSVCKNLEHRDTVLMMLLRQLSSSIETHS